MNDVENKSSIQLEKDLNGIIKNSMPNQILKMNYTNPRVLFHMINILNNQDIKDLFTDEQWDELMNNIDESLKSEENRLEYVFEMMRYSLAKTEDWNKSIEELLSKNPDTTIILKEFAVPVLLVIEELLKEQNCTFSDICICGTGSYSVVYKIGNRILKLGDKRKVSYVINSDKILQPILKKDLNGKKFAMTIEVTNRVKLFTDDEYEENDEKIEEILYEIWKELMDEGIIWTDPRIENIGILLSDNIQTLDGEPLYVDPDSIKVSHRIETLRKKGEVVVIDIDFLFSKSDLNIKVGSSLYWKFKERYKKEKNKHNVEYNNK